MKSTRHRSQSGFSLIEMLVAVVIFSIGMIGIALLQLRGLSYTKDSGSRTQATVLARAMADRMRATMQESFRGPVIGNVDWMDQVRYGYPNAGSCPNACNTTLQAVANADVAWLRGAIAQRLPPVNSGDELEIVKAAGTSQMYTVTIRWGEGTEDQRYTIDVYPM